MTTSPPAANLFRNYEIGIATNILKHAAIHFGYSAKQILGRYRPLHLSMPRTVTIALMAEMTHFTHREIGAIFGGRDTTTISVTLKRFGAGSPAWHKHRDLLKTKVKGVECKK